MDKLQGVSIFEGIVIAKPYMKKKKKEEIKIYKITPDMIEDELKRFQDSVRETKEQIKILIESLAGKVNQKDIKILNVHLMMLEDPVFLSDITNKIKIEMINSEKIVETVVMKYVGMFKSLDDPMYKQRAVDIEDVGEKIIQSLQGEKDEIEDLSNKILISKDVKPSELLRYYNQGIKIAGIATELGGETSHVAILAKTLNIPTLMNIKNITSANWSEKKEIILDSRKGKEFILISSDAYVKKWYQKELKELKIESKELERLIGVPALTKCNKRIYLHANVASTIEIDEIKKYKPDGIGLLRTEFLYMESEYFPSEKEQFEIYKKMSKSVGKGKPVIIRTLDIGADKKLNYFDLPSEDNPFLGLRAIRLSLKHKDIFKVQLRAILKASYYGNIKIMYPMISGLNEIIEANAVLEEAKEELRMEKELFNEEIEVGIMIEIPSAAIMAEILINEVDFFSIGTNDLTQYMLAADRLSKEVSYIYNNYHPAVLRIINSVAECAINAGKKVSVCGEMSGDALALLAFLSFGIKDLSMLPSFMPKIKKIIQEIDLNSLKVLKRKLLMAKTVKEVKDELNDFLVGVM